MAQKILLRRGGIGNIGSTIAVSKGELLYASGSTNGVENVVFIANADGNNTFTPVNKLNTGTAGADTFSARLDGLPYYNSTSQSLHILTNGGSVTPLDLSGNLEGTTVSSMTVTTLTNTTLNTDTVNASGNITGSNLKLTGNADIAGNVTIGGNITVGDATTDFINFGGEISSSFIPDIDSAFDLGSTTKYWRTVYADSFSGSVGSTVDVDYVNTFDLNADGVVSASVLYVDNSAQIDINLNVGAGVTTNDLYVGTGANIGTFQMGTGNTDKFRVTSDTGNTKIAGTLDVTGSVTLGSALTVAGTTSLNGNIVLGDAASDTVAFKADVSSSIIPSANATFDIGASSDKWLHGYFVSASIDSLTISGIDPTAQDLDDVMNNGNSTNNDFILNNNGNQAITHTGATGNLTVSSDNGDVYIEGTRFTGNDVIVAGNLTVAGTQTIVNSTTVEIGDNIIVLNAAGVAADGGIIVRDAVGAQQLTGSLLWNATDDYWYAGVSGSTQYRLAQFASGTGVTTNRIPKADGSTRLTNSIITDDGTTVTVAGTVSGSIVNASTGITAVGLQGVIDTSSRAIFRDGSNRLGALATTDSAVEVTTVLGYKADGTFVATSVIDGGTF